MSYDVEFQLNGETVNLAKKHSISGGTYALGGTTEASLNITYNYGRFFRQVFGESGIRSLYGKTARELIPILAKGIAELNVERNADYWAGTSGNAGAALLDLLTLAAMVPKEAVLTGD